MIKQLDSSDAEVRRSAAAQLGWQGRSGIRTLPLLTRLLDDNSPDVRIVAASSIWEITRQPGTVVPILVEHARSPVQSVSSQAIQALGRIGADARRSLPDLRKTLYSNTGLIQVSIAETILQIDEADSAAFDILSAALKDTDANVRCQAAYALARAVNSHPEDAVNRMLRPLLRDEAASVVTAARSTLNRLGEVARSEQHARQDASQNKLSRLVLQLHDRDARLRKEALAHLAWLGADARSVLYDIESRLQDESEPVRAAAAWASWSVGHRSEAAVNTLRPMLTSQDPKLVTLAADILGNMREHAQPALLGLRTQMQHSDGISKLHLATTIVKIDPSDNVAANVLISFLRDSDTDARSRAAYELTAIGLGQVGRVVAPLAKCLNDEEEAVRSAASLTIAEFLESNQPGMTGLTAYVVAGLGSEAEPLLPILHKVLATTGGLDRLQIAEAIVSIDALDSVAVDALIAGMSAKETMLRCQAAYALSRIDPLLRDRALEPLSQAAKDSDDKVRLAARSTLKALSGQSTSQPNDVTQSNGSENSPETNAPQRVDEDLDALVAKLASSSLWEDRDEAVKAPIPVKTLPLDDERSADVTKSEANSRFLRSLPLDDEIPDGTIVRTSNSVMQPAANPVSFRYHRLPVRLDQELVEAATIWSRLYSID